MSNGRIKPESRYRAPEDLHSDETMAGVKRRIQWQHQLRSVFMHELKLHGCEHAEIGYLSSHLVKRIMRWARRTGYFEHFPIYKSDPKYAVEPRRRDHELEMVGLLDRYAKDPDFRLLVDKLASMLYDLGAKFKRQDVVDALDVLGLPHSIHERYHHKLLWLRHNKLRRRVNARLKKKKKNKDGEMPAMQRPEL